MAKVLQLRRGTTSENDAFTGAIGELTVDTENHGLRLHDGATVGGHPIHRPSNVIAVKDFGAVGDGVTDDTDALNRAFAKGGIILFQAGKRYLARGALRVPVSGTEIHMSGSTIVGNGMLYNFKNDDTYTGYNGVGRLYIHDGAFEGVSVAFIHGAKITFERVDFVNMEEQHAMQICACRDFVIEGCTFNGLKTTTASNPHYEYINIDPCNRTAFPYLPNGSPSFDGTKNDRIVVKGCLFVKGSGNYAAFDDAVGAHYDDGTGTLHKDIHVYDSTINDCGAWAVRLEACEDSSVEGCTINTVKFAVGTGNTIRSKNITVRNNTICSIRTTGTYGPMQIGAHRCDNLAFYDNTIRNVRGDFLCHLDLATLASGESELTISRLQKTIISSIGSAGSFALQLPATQLTAIYAYTGSISGGTFTEYKCQTFATERLLSGSQFKHYSGSSQIVFTINTDSVVIGSGNMRYIVGECEPV